MQQLLCLNIWIQTHQHEAMTRCTLSSCHLAGCCLSVQTARSCKAASSNNCSWSCFYSKQSKRMQLFDLPGDPCWELPLCKTFFRLNHCFVFCLVPKIFLLVRTEPFAQFHMSVLPLSGPFHILLLCTYIHLATTIYSSFSQEISNNCGVVLLLKRHKGEQQLEATIWRQ